MKHKDDKHNQIRPSISSLALLVTEVEFSYFKAEISNEFRQMGQLRFVLHHSSRHSWWNKWEQGVFRIHESVSSRRQTEQIYSLSCFWSFEDILTMGRYFSK